MSCKNNYTKPPVCPTLFIKNTRDFVGGMEAVCLQTYSFTSVE